MAPQVRLLNRLVVPQVAGRFLEQDPAVLEDEGVGRDFEAHQHREDLLDECGRDAESGLIEQHQRGARHEGAAEARPLLPPR